MGQVLVNGVFLGALFAVVAVGLTLVYGVMEVPNFAHAGVIVLAAYATWEAAERGAPFVLAALIGIATGGVVSVATELLAYRWVRSNPVAAPAVALGLLLIMQNAAPAALDRRGQGPRHPVPGIAAALRRASRFQGSSWR